MPYTTVSLPKSLIRLIQERIKGTEYSSPSAYVTHVLEELEQEIEKLTGGQSDE
jgi:Arc/MetJ-type ribon-helix-helix transcriptional regulator